MGDRHVALIVEDDTATADSVKNVVTSLGHEWRHAATLVDLRAEIARGGYCYVLLDTRVLPIVVVTRYSRDPDFASKTYETVANAFIAKPFAERVDLTPDKLRAALARAEREEHASCATASLSGMAASSTVGTLADDAGAVQIAFDGTGAGGRSIVLANEESVSLQDMLFAPLLKMAAIHQRSPVEWSSKEKLGIATRTWVISRLRAAFKGVVPEGFEIVETHKGTGYRLNPSVVVKEIAWGALAKHGKAAVRKIAADWGARGVPSHESRFASVRR